MIRGFVAQAPVAGYLIVLLCCLSISPLRADGTEAQHQDWARKFHTPGGTINREAIDGPPSMRMEVDIQRLLRCEVYRQHLGADAPPLDGC